MLLNKTKSWSLDQPRLHVLHKGLVGLMNGEAEGNLTGVCFWKHSSAGIIAVKELDGWASGKPKWGDCIKP